MALAGAALYGKQAGRLDDLARTVGVDPRRKPADSDKKLLTRVQKAQSALLLQTRAVAQHHRPLATALEPAIARAQAQLGQLGGEVKASTPAPPDSAEDAINSVITLHKVAADERAGDAVKAVSGEFAQVLASISVSAEQSVVALRAARKELL